MCRERVLTGMCLALVIFLLGHVRIIVVPVDPLPQPFLIEASNLSATHHVELQITPAKINLQCSATHDRPRGHRDSQTRRVAPDSQNRPLPRPRRGARAGLCPAGACPRPRLTLQMGSRRRCCPEPGRLLGGLRAVQLDVRELSKLASKNKERNNKKFDI